MSRRLHAVDAEPMELTASVIGDQQLASTWPWLSGLNAEMMCLSPS